MRLAVIQKQIGVLRLFFFFTAFLGIPLLIVGYRQQARDQQATNWPSVPGIITRVEHDFVRSGGGPPEGSHEVVRIMYAYDVEGVRYVNDNIYLGRGRFNDLRFADIYPVNTIVDVYYDPLDLNHSCLRNRKPGMKAIIIFGWLLSSFSVIAVMMQLLVFIHSWKHSQLKGK